MLAGRPHMVALTEAQDVRQAPAGYKLYRPTNDKDRSVAALVRDDLKVTNVVSLHMDEPWKWHKPKPPRTYLGLTVEGVDYLIVHYPAIRGDRPNTAAREESFTRSAKYGNTGVRRTGPFVCLGDMNMKGDSPRTRLARRLDGKTTIASTGPVDHAIARNATLTATRSPGYKGPGHGAGRYVITPTKETP